MTAALYVGTTGSQASGGSNASHLVADTTTGRTHCGKRAAECWGPLTPAQLRAEVTCRSCLRGLQ